MPVITVRCVTCLGTGRYHGRVCPLCEGKKRIEVIEGDDDDD